VGYYFYTRSAADREYVLTAVKSVFSGSDVGPSYSGLASFKNTDYSPPLTIVAKDIQPRAGPVTELRMQFVQVPFGKDVTVGLLRIGPLSWSRRQSARSIETLAMIGASAGGLLSILAENAHLTDRYKAMEVMAKASSTASSSALGGRQFVDTFIGLGAKLAGAAAGAVFQRHQRRFSIYGSTGLSETEVAKVAADPEACAPLSQVAPGQPAIAMPPPGAPVCEAMRRISPAMTTIFPIGGDAYLVYWFSSQVNLAKYLLTAVYSVASRIGDALQNERLYRDMSRSYLDSLRAITSAMDAAQAYTVTHSSLIARYSRGIAEELGLAEASTIETAAYLHDVGMVALDEKVLFKNGRYEKNEYEDMKSHTEIGAALVASVIEPPGLADIIRHHHERWDGWGYPAGLKIDSIPLGARVVAVADTFNAKVSSRAYRAGLPFEKALADVKAASGAQFDPVAVDAFVRWWEKKEARQSPERSLEPCWEMTTCPAGISSTCPAFRAPANCWTVPDIKCALHGDVCENCIVKSEYQARTSRPRGAAHFAQR
jgi:putative nucleotidyltransferase with HDIG domain